MSEFPIKYQTEIISNMNNKIIMLEKKYMNQYLNDVLKYYQKDIEIITSMIIIIFENEKNNQKNNANKCEKIFKMLHEYSKRKGGFIAIENRKIIYKFIINTIYDNNILNVLNNEDININNIVDQNEMKSIKDIIVKDCERSVLFSIRSYEESKYEKELNEEEIRKYIDNLKLFVYESLGKKLDITYFQGYQEICLFFMIIFGEKEGPLLTYKFTKIFLNYVTTKNLKNKLDFGGVLDVLNVARYEINPNSKNLLDNITKTKPYYALSWVITWFTHDNHSLFKQFRLIDYLITSEISSIFFFSGALISYEFEKLRQLYNITANGENWDELMGEIFKHFQNIQFKEDDVIDKLIEITERNNYDGNFKYILEKSKILNNNNPVFKEITYKIFPYSIPSPLFYKYICCFNNKYTLLICLISLLIFILSVIINKININNQ